MNDARCAALFASGLQQSDAPDGHHVSEAVSRTVRRFGIRGCAGLVAQEFGDHPEAAAARMRWVRQLIGEGPAPAACPPVDGARRAVCPPVDGARRAACPASSQRVSALSAACPYSSAVRQQYQATTDRNGRYGSPSG